MPNSSITSIIPNEGGEEIGSKSIRRPFIINQNPKPEADKTISIEAASKLNDLYKSGHINKSQFGEAVIGNYVSTLAKIGINFGHPNPDQASAIRSLDQYYGIILGKDEFKRRKTGALGEFAAMLAVSKVIDATKLPWSVLQATPEEDLYNGVDFVIRDNETGSTVAFQVKSVGMRNSPKRFIYPFSDEQSLKGFINLTTGKESELSIVNWGNWEAQELYKSGKKLLDYQDPEATETRRAFILLPSPEGDTATFSSFSGIPSDGMYDNMYREVIGNFVLANTTKNDR